MSSKGPFPGQQFLLRVTSSCLLAHSVGDKPEDTELCSDLCLQGLSKGTLSWAMGRHAVSYCDSARTAWVISGSLGKWPWDCSQTAARLCTGQSFSKHSPFDGRILLPIFLFEKGGHTVLATDTRHRGVTVTYYLVLSSTAQQICCFQEEICQKKRGNVKRWHLRKGGKKTEEAGAHRVNFRH